MTFTVVTTADLEVGDLITEARRPQDAPMTVDRILKNSLRLRQAHWLCECPMKANGDIACDPGTHEKLDDIVFYVPATPSTTWGLIAPLVTVRIENGYENGHESETDVEVPTPDIGSIIDWWDDTVFVLTGDGIGLGKSFHSATITMASNPDLIGLSHSWGG